MPGLSGYVMCGLSSKLRAITGDALLRRDGRHCFWCGDRLSLSGNDLEYATLDQLAPLTLDGSDDLANLVLACRLCNGERGYWLSDFCLRWQAHWTSAPPMRFRAFRLRAMQPSGSGNRDANAV